MTLSCDVRTGRPPVSGGLPSIGSRIGVDSEPLDLADPATAAWLAACVPPEAGAVTRFAAAAAVARADPTRMVRGDLVDVLPQVVAELPRDELLCLVDTYVHVFLPPPELARFVALSTRSGASATSTGSRSTRSCRWARRPPTRCRASPSTA